MKLNYDQLNKITGWSVFAIALITYWLTVEPTVSYWDAGEYIATSSGLQVGHPPGAPLYQMLGAFFSMFALEKSQIAYMVNMMSVFASAFAILFMFWSLTLLLKRHILKTTSNDSMILGAAAIGSLAYAFSDSFWFNAVEAEVYAPAALLMSALFYMGLLWERDMHLPRGNRWLVLISFVVGLSFGVHFMGILTIPAIGLLWYFKHYKKITILNFIVANIAVVAVLLFVFKLLLPYTLSIFGYMEVFFVNDIGLPFNSGSIIMLVLVVALFVFLIRFSQKRNKPLLNTITLCVMFVLIGFSSWTMLPIRANAGTPINENNPNDARALLAYYNREQYPAPALFYGEAFTDIYAGLDPDNPYLDEKPKYEKDYELGKYVIVNNYKNALQNTHDDHKGLFPRMTDPSRASNYINFMGGLNYTIKPEYATNKELIGLLSDYERNFNSGRMEADEYISFLQDLQNMEGGIINIQKPDGIDNARYFMNYQVQYMYLRYFMWNFTGRQNDIQGEGGKFNGNWLSGIPFIDEWHLGTQDNLSEDMLNNKARNTYFFLPLILGLIGMIFHAKKDLKSFYVTLTLFLFTGLAIIVYLNQSMYQVRERDYAYVGSFLVFGMWIGIGAYSVYEGIKGFLNAKTARALSLVACFVAVPFLMAFQNWDDHDRSGKYTALASAKKYLDSCLPNALIFTIGDNDTFPLWYLQEVEGYRTDVRVVCTSLLATDWYMDDMKKKAWDSEPVPSTLTHDKYSYGTRDALWFADKERVLQRTGGKSTLPDTLDIKDWMEWVASENKITQEQMRNDHWEHTFPTKYVRIPVNKEAVLKNGVVPEKDANLIVDEIVIEINSSLVYKNRMFMLDIINANNWERPIYFSGGAFGDEDYIWMKDYLQLDGCAFRLLPIKTDFGNSRNPFNMGRVDPLHGYEIIKNWDWGNSGDPDMYHDVETRRNSIGYRNNLSRVAAALTEIGENAKAEEILDLGMEKMPLEIFENYSMISEFVNAYYKNNNRDKARDLAQRVIAKFQDEIDHYKMLTYEERGANIDNIGAAISRYNEIIEIAIMHEDDALVQQEAATYDDYVKEFPKIFGDDFLINKGVSIENPGSDMDNIFKEAADNTETEDLIESNPQDAP